MNAIIFTFLRLSIYHKSVHPSNRSVGRLFASTKETIAEEIFTKHELSYIFATVIMNAFAQKHLLRGQLRVYPFISGFERFSPHQFHINNDFYIVFFLAAAGLFSGICIYFCSSFFGNRQIGKIFY